MVHETILEVLAKTTAQFLKENGGDPSGQHTWVEGCVRLNVEGGLILHLPKFQPRETIDEARAAGLALERKVQDVMLRFSWTEGVYFTCIHREDDYYDIQVSLEPESITVVLTQEDP